MSNDWTYKKPSGFSRWRSLLFDRIAPKLPRFVRRPLLHLRGLLSNPYERWRKTTYLRFPRMEPAEAPVLFSVLTLVYDPEPQHLEACARSVLQSQYPHFEWVLVNNGCRNPKILELLRRLKSDKRVRLLEPETGLGISFGTMRAAQEAQGDWLVFVDHDDLLDPTALGKFAAYANATHNLIYSDHDHCDEIGNRFDPVFKPGPSKELVLSFNYVTHLHAVRKAFFLENIQPSRLLDGSQDWDVTLRALENPKLAVHVPEILYTHRQHPGQFSATHHRSREKTNTQVAKSQIEVLSTYLERNQLRDAYRIEETAQIGCYRLSSNRKRPRPPSFKNLEAVHALHWKIAEPYFSIVHPELLPPLGWESEMVGILERNPEVAIVTGRIRHQNGGYVPHLYTMDRLRGVRPRQVRDPHARQETSGASAWWWMARTRAFDELAPTGSTDVHYCLALRENGWSIVCAPDLVATLSGTLDFKLNCSPSELRLPIRDPFSPIFEEGSA